MEHLTFVCLGCQKAFRLGTSACRPGCPFCGAALYQVEHVPPKSKPKEWAALRRRLFRMETGFHHEVAARANELLSREGQLERQQGRKYQKLARKAAQHRKKLKNSLGEG